MLGGVVNYIIILITCQPFSAAWYTAIQHTKSFIKGHTPAQVSVRLGSCSCDSASLSACNAGDPGLIPESGRSAGEGIGYPLQYSGLENSMDYIVH